jgi:hypothetical protein
MKKLVTKKRIVIGSLALAGIVAGGIFFIALQDPAPPILRAMYPYFHIEKLAGPDHYTFGNTNGFEFDFFAREILIGEVPFYAVAENDSAGTSRYMFLAIALDPELLIEIEKAPRAESAEEAFEQNIFQVDITGDGTKEVFVRTVSEEGFLGYTILRVEGEGLKEIHADLGLESWTNVKYVGFEDGAVLFSHDPEGNYDESAYGRYFVVEDALVSEENVRRRDQSEGFRTDLVAASEDSVWSPLARAFDESCEILPESVLNPQGLLFRPMVAALEPVKTLPNGSRVYIIPCMLHAYQSSQMPAIFDGTTYEPLLIHEMDYDGNPTESYTTIELGYDPAKDLFTSYGKGRGIGDCGAGYEYKLAGKELVLQRMEADTECDGEYESRVLFDINS